MESKKNNMGNQINITGSGNSFNGEINQSFNLPHHQQKADSNTSTDLRKKVMILISKGELEEALDEIINNTIDEDIQNSCTLLLGRVNLLKKKQIKNLSSSQEIDIEHAKIANAILELVGNE